MVKVTRTLRWASVVALVAVAVMVFTQPGEALSDNWWAAEAKVMEHEEAISACMAERGWEYVAALPADVLIQREIVRAESEGRTAPDPAEIELPVDPNQQIIAQLTEEAKQARASAFWGDLDTGGSDPGCYVLTYQAVWDVDLMDPEHEEIAANLEATIESDPRVLRALDAYIACMAADGILVSRTMEVYEDYTVGIETLSELEGQEGETPQSRAAWNALDAWWADTKPAHDHCIGPYYEIEEAVRGEFLREHGIWND